MTKGKEGDTCGASDNGEPPCEGTLEYPPVKNCSCHINPPCNACIENPLTCTECFRELEQ
jgi:hypothetical protein